MSRRSIDDVVSEVRGGLVRVEPGHAAEMVAAGALLVDIRPVDLREKDGEIPGAEIIGRNVLEWRLDPQSPARLAGVDDGIYERDVIVFCDEGYASSLAARDLQGLGLEKATDLIGGFQAWRRHGLPVTPP
jgi:rhodanese-related sulfurtransferase